MTLEHQYISALGLEVIGDGMYLAPTEMGKGIRITIFWDDDMTGMFKMVGRYKAIAFGPTVKQISYINHQSLSTFGQLAIDDPERPTQFQILVIDHLIKILIGKSKDKIEMN